MSRPSGPVLRLTLGAPKEELQTLRDQIVSTLERAWEITGGSEDQLLSTMMQISQVVAQQFNKQE